MYLLDTCSCSGEGSHPPLPSPSHTHIHIRSYTLAHSLCASDMHIESGTNTYCCSSHGSTSSGRGWQGGREAMVADRWGGLGPGSNNAGRSAVGNKPNGLTVTGNILCALSVGLANHHEHIAVFRSVGQQYGSMRSIRAESSTAEAKQAWLPSDMCARMQLWSLQSRCPLSFSHAPIRTYTFHAVHLCVCLCVCRCWCSFVLVCVCMCM